MTITATVDFGIPAGTADADIDNFPYCVDVSASPGGTLAPAGTTAEGTRFVGQFTLPAQSASVGREVVDLSWAARNPGRSNCSQELSGDFNKVAAPYVANRGSGPVQYLDLDAYYGTGAQQGAPVPDPNSVEKNDPGNQWYDYVVTVGLPVPLQVKPYTDGPILLRMASPSGSQNQAFDCDKNVNFEREIENGCSTKYIENFRDHDDDDTTPKQWNNFLCTGWGTGNLPPPTFNGPAPYPSDCVMTETGDKTGQLRQGLADRFESPACTPNGWPTNQAEADDFFGPDGWATQTTHATSCSSSRTTPRSPDRATSRFRSSTSQVSTRPGGTSEAQRTVAGPGRPGPAPWE